MENNERFAMKSENFRKALNREETDFIPTVMSSSGGTIFWTGKTVYDVVHDPVAYAGALTDVLKDVWVDASVLNGYTTTPPFGPSVSRSGKSLRRGRNPFPSADPAHEGR